jgi:hypothetical protein
MATLTQAGITFNTTGGNRTVVATPAAADLIIVFIAMTGVASGLGVTDDNADGHGSYTQINSSLKAASADMLAAFVRADPIRSATSTTWTTSGGGASTGGGLVVSRISGLTLSGPAAVRASGVQSNQAAATPAPAFPQAALTANLCIGAVFNATNPATMTIPASWAAEDNDVGYATPTAGLQTCHRNSGETGTTITWGSASASAFCDLIVELSVAQGNLAVLMPPLPPLKQAVKRKSVFMLGQLWSRKGRLLVPRPGIWTPEAAR